MYNIKGFFVNEALITNGPGVVAQFGELSTYALTFAKDKGFYSLPGFPSLSVAAFKSVDDTNVPVVVPANVVQHLMGVSDYLYGRFNSGTIGASIPTLIGELEAEFNSGDITIENIVINALVSDVGNAGKRLPDNMLWDMIDAGPGGGEYQLKFWFSDAEFRVQYDEYEIVAIPPLDPVDQFYQNNANVGIDLAAVSHGDILDAAAAAADGNPYTLLKHQTYQWREHEDFGSATRNVDWYFLVWGIAGDNPDAYNQAIRDYLSDEDNTNIDTQDWQQMFPGAFETSEYYIVPLWSRVQSSVPSVIYSPVSRPSDLVNRAKLNVAFTAADAFWNTNLSVTTSVYQAISTLIIGSVTNTANADYDFQVKFSDYLNIPLSHPDAGRMSPSTQGFVTMMTTLIQHAETLTASTPQNTLPNGYSRVTKSGRIYLSVVYEGTRYFAISKNAYNAA